MMVPSRVRAVVLLVLLVVVACGSRGGDGDIELTTSTASLSLPPVTDALRPFDVEAFMASKLDGVFDDEVIDQVGVVVLAPERLAPDVEWLFTELTEIRGLSYVLAGEVREAADRFAARENIKPLDGRWVAYGLEPQYVDSPVAEWQEILGQVEGVLITRVDFEPLFDPSTVLDEGWEGWQIATALSFGISDSAIVKAVETGVVVVEPTITRLIGFEGSVTSIDGSPLTVPEGCCLTVIGFAAGDSLVLIDDMTADTWILDVQGLTWRRADPKPSVGEGHGKHPLGAVLIGGELLVVDAASRIGENVSSTMEALDLDSGSWRVMEPVPSPISVGGVTTDGERVVVAGTRQDQNNRIIGDRNPLLYQYTEDQGWNRLASIPIDGQSSTVVWVEGTGFLGWNYDLESALFDQSDSWRRLDRVPMPESECHPQSTPVTAGIVGRCGGIAFFDNTTKTWAPIWPGSAQAWAVDPKFAVTENMIIALVEVVRDQTKMLIYPLPPNGS